VRITLIISFTAERNLIQLTTAIETHVAIIIVFTFKQRLWFLLLIPFFFLSYAFDIVYFAKPASPRIRFV